MKSNSSRLFGVFFILSFITYATGMGLMGAIQNSQLQASQVMESKATLVIGGLLIAVFHTLFNMGLLVIMYRVLKPINTSLVSIYLVLGCLATLLLALGAVFLLLPIPISETINPSNPSEVSFFSMILGLASSGNFYSYQLGMILWGCGGLLFCYLIYHSQLVPVLFPRVGFGGYLLFIMGCVLELFGIPYGVAFSVPGGLFEIGLSTWLIVKGFTVREVLSSTNY